LKLIIQVTLRLIESSCPLLGFFSWRTALLIGSRLSYFFKRFWLIYKRHPQFKMQHEQYGGKSMSRTELFCCLRCAVAPEPCETLAVLQSELAALLAHAPHTTASESRTPTLTNLYVPFLVLRVLLRVQARSLINSSPTRFFLQPTHIYLST
jgi:hypothetical protein